MPTSSFFFFLCTIGIIQMADAAFAPESKSTPPTMLLGPTANLPSHTELVRQLLDLVEGANATAAWPKTFDHVHTSGGALHVRQQVFGFMTPSQQEAFARATARLGLRVSVESGGALCGAGAGAALAAANARKLSHFLGAGGRFAFVALESVFSRTRAACRGQSVANTAKELAAYAATLSADLHPAAAPPLFFLYDALPHMAVGAKWPANIPRYDLELGEVLDALESAMRGRGVELSGYWMDCPYEYSRDYPNATAPLPAGSGFERVAAAAALVRARGLKVGKTFNSQQGGAKSDELFFNNTLRDWTEAAEAGATFDYAMVETWYPHPAIAAPEREAYSTTYTAAHVFDKCSRA